MPQVGIYSSYQLGLHDHSNNNLGGLLGTIERVAGAVVNDVVSAGDSLTAAAAFTLVKRVRINEVTPGEMDISFDLQASAGTAHGRIYVNGVAVGLDQTQAAPAVGTKTEAIIRDFAAGDNVEIYAYCTGGGTAHVTALTFTYSPVLANLGGKEFAAGIALSALNAIGRTVIVA